MLHKAWCGIENVPYYFSGSCIKFQGHTGWKIDDLNPIWVGLLGRSQLSIIKSLRFALFFSVKLVNDTQDGDTFSPYWPCKYEGNPRSTSSVSAEHIELPSQRSSNMKLWYSFLWKPEKKLLKQNKTSKKNKQNRRVVGELRYVNAHVTTPL